MHRPCPDVRFRRSIGIVRIPSSVDVIVLAARLAPARVPSVLVVVVHGFFFVFITVSALFLDVIPVRRAVISQSASQGMFIPELAVYFTGVLPEVIPAIILLGAAVSQVVNPIA